MRISMTWANSRVNWYTDTNGTEEFVDADVSRSISIDVAEEGLTVAGADSQSALGDAFVEFFKVQIAAAVVVHPPENPSQ